ncbi:hypothetical protein [Thalassobacillus hwangdonensis]|uniref:Aminoglycoside phosphotransferase domain-containing protein n=1 Tax=Thalassobacillus hwangdonensis TaxID=546108 RepID=A0ABW3L1M4_9BACI
MKMNILSSTAQTEIELITLALEKEGLPTKFERLGEGAWHYAYYIPKEDLVLRLPKKIAYDKEVAFDEKLFKTEYEGTKQFYSHANKVKEDICPKYFRYTVSEPLTYTIESYAGRTTPLADQTPAQAKLFGREIGSFFLGLEELEAPLPGVGYLTLNDDEKLTGFYNMNLQAMIREETEEYQQELEALLSSPYPFDKEKVAAFGRELIAQRAVESEKCIFTNQDTSPENILFTSGGIRIIDPYPILYTGTSLAANFAFNYQTLFHSLHNTRRYGKGNYQHVVPQLKANAEGFIEAYTSGSEQKQKDLTVEVFIKLVTMAHDHLDLLQRERLNEEQIIRFGTKGQIEERLRFFLNELEHYPRRMKHGIL